MKSSTWLCQVNTSVEGIISTERTTRPLTSQQFKSIMLFTSKTRVEYHGPTRKHHISCTPWCKNNHTKHSIFSLSLTTVRAAMYYSLYTFYSVRSIFSSSAGLYPTCTNGRDGRVLLAFLFSAPGRAFRSVSDGCLSSMGLMAMSCDTSS